MTKLFSKVLLLLCCFYLPSQLLAQQPCSIQVNGQQFLCATDGSFIYTAGPHSGSFVNWSLDPAGSGTIGFANASQASVTFSNSFAGCWQSVRVNYHYTINEINYTCYTNVAVYKDQSGTLTTISGPAFVAPSASWINSLPPVNYSVPALSCGSYLWTTPNGWTITSGNGTNSIMVSPTISSDCSGTVRVKWSNGYCEKTLSLPVSRAPLANGTLNSYCKAVDSWTTLFICEGDELFMDASPTTFCGGSNNIFISVTPCDAAWNPLAPELMQWLSPPQYAALGGLAHLDMNLLAATYLTPFTFSSTPGYYKIKLAVGSPWNERAFQVVVNPSTPAPPGNYHIIVPQPTIDPNFKTVDLVWTGVPGDLYEVVYEYSDAPTFPKPGTTTVCRPCGSALPYVIPGTVYVSVTIPICHHFRYRVRKCACQEWYGPAPWATWSGPLCKKGWTGVVEEQYAQNGISIYPNPVQNITTISFDKPVNEKLNVEVYDLQGKKVLSEALPVTGTGKHELNISALSNGLYMAKVINESGEVLYLTKLVKE